MKIISKQIFNNFMRLNLLFLFSLGIVVVVVVTVTTMENTTKSQGKGKREFIYYGTYNIHGLGKTFQSDTIKGLAKELGINHLTAINYCKLQGRKNEKGRIPIRIHKVKKAQA